MRCATFFPRLPKTEICLRSRRRVVDATVSVSLQRSIMAGNEFDNEIQNEIIPNLPLDGKTIVLISNGI